MSTDSLHVDDDTFVLVLTGAGASAESGIPTFRGVDGLWRNHPIEDVASAVNGRFVFLAVGTSGVVFPAAQLVHQTLALGADTWLVNAEPAANDGAFHHVLHGRSGDLLPALLGVV